MLDIEFDPEKDRTNIAKHRISLLRAADMEMLAVERDDRFEYDEERFRAWGYLDGLGYCFAFTTRGNRIRAISLRRAHRKEMLQNVPQSR